MNELQSIIGKYSRMNELKAIEKTGGRECPSMDREHAGSQTRKTTDKADQKGSRMLTIARSILQKLHSLRLARSSSSHVIE
jgi:hypothetical protein